MQISLLQQIMRLLKLRKNQTADLWHQAEPINLDELEQQLMLLTRKFIAEQQLNTPAPQTKESMEELWGQLEKLWEQMEQLDELNDCRVII